MLIKFLLMLIKQFAHFLSHMQIRNNFLKLLFLYVKIIKQLILIFKEVTGMDAGANGRSSNSNLIIGGLPVILL